MKTTHPSRRKAHSQCSKILRALERARDLALAGKGDGWVSLVTLWRCSGSMAVHSRIADLRLDGHDIEQFSKHVNGSVHSFYRLRPQTKPQPA